MRLIKEIGDKKECDGILVRLQGAPRKVYCLYVIISPILKIDPPSRIDLVISEIRNFVSSLVVSKIP